MNMSSAIRIGNIHREINRQTVLQDVNLSLLTGRTLGLIGLNGAGKTTLIKCMLDLQQADQGEITIFGVDSRNKNARNHLIYLPEKFMPPDYMQGWTYLHYIADAHIIDADGKKHWRAAVPALCQRLELETEALGKNVKALSKGMLQKLGLIGCLLSDKKLFLLDEPMSGLDPKARVLLRNAILELKAQQKTIMLCTHILNDIEMLCDQIGILHEGRLLYSGSVTDCLAHYGTGNLETAFLKAIE